MTTFYRRLSVIFLVSCGFVLLQSAAFASHSWGSYHWARTSNPFTLKLGDNVTSAWDSYLATASSDWTASSVLNTTIVAGSTSGRKCRPSTGTIQVCNASYGNNGWLGLAQIWASGNHITQGTAKMNDTYFNSAQYNTPAWKRMVVCQEVAHCFGLDHQDENFNNGNLGSCMDYTSDPDGPPSNEHPNSHDFDQLVTIYTHLDSTTTVSAAPPAMNQIDFDTPGQWGKLLRRSEDGRGELYVLDFGHGHKVFTFVIWANERKNQVGVNQPLR